MSSEIPRTESSKLDVIVAFVLIGIAAAPVALLAGWFAGPGVRGVAQLVRRGNDDWWRSTLPWPTGVQEDDEIAWSARASAPGRGETSRVPSLRVEARPLHPTLRRR